MSEWSCRYCGLTTEASHVDMQEELVTLREDSAQGRCTFRLVLVVCPSLACRELTARLAVYPLIADSQGALRIQGEPARTWDLIPSGSGKPLPDYVPERIVKEYAEACGALEISPAAAATLSRRCLQAIIRDFFGVKKNTLADELDAVKDKLDPELWTLIDETRRSGNIGKNMEKGVNLIFDPEPGEAQRLIGIIECLIDECYVVRHQRKQRLDAMRHSRGPA